MSNVINNTAVQAYIPEEVFLEILQWLPEEVLLTAQTVNSSWLRICSDNILWGPILSSKTAMPFPRQPRHSFLEHYMLNKPGLNIHRVQSQLGKCYAAWGKTIAVWKKTTSYPQVQYECTYTDTDHASSINAFFFHKKSYVPYIVTGSADTTLKVWKMVIGTEQFELIETLKGHQSPVITLTGTTHSLFSGSLDGKVCVWNDNRSSSSPLYTLQQTLETGQKSISALEADGKTSYFQLFTGGVDGTIKVWKKKSGQLVCTQALVGHQGEVTSLRYDASSRLLFSSSADRCIRVWNTVNNQYICVSWIPDAHHAKLSDILPFNQGKQVVTAAVDGSVKLWKEQDDGKWKLEATLEVGEKNKTTTLSSGSQYQTFPQVYAVAAGVISQLDFPQNPQEDSIERTYFPVTTTPSTVKETVVTCKEKIATM